MQLYTVSNNPSLDPVAARRLSRSNKADVRRAVAQNPNTPADVLLSLIKEFPGEVLQNAVLPLLLLEDPQLLRKIETNRGDELGKILFHESFPPELLEDVFLAKMDSWYISETLSHPKCPKWLIISGLRVIEGYRRSYLLCGLLRHAEITEQDIVTYCQPSPHDDHRTSIELAKCKVTPPSMLAGLLGSGNAEVRCNAAMNARTPGESLALLYLAGASLDLKRFTEPGSLMASEMNQLRSMGPFGEALWARLPQVSARELQFRPSPLWLAALASRADLPKDMLAQIKTWTKGRGRKIKHLKEELRAKQKEETRKKNKKKARVSLRPGAQRW